MTDGPSELPQLPLKLSLLALIGLSDPEQGDWATLRALQYGQIHRLQRSRGIAHAIALLITISLFYGKVPLAYLVAWPLGVIAALWNSMRIDTGLADVDRRSMTRRDFWRQTLGVAGSATMWAIALLVFTPFGSKTDHLALWTVVGMLMAGCAFIMAAAPMAAIVFSAIAGAAALISFLEHGDWTFAAVVAAFGTITIGGALNVARTFLAAQIAEAGVVEKSEVVSLLLREYEDNEADWLWQVDTNRKVRGTSPRFAYARGCDSSDVEVEAGSKLIAGTCSENGQFPPSLHDVA